MSAHMAMHPPAKILPVVPAWPPGTTDDTITPCPFGWLRIVRPSDEPPLLSSVQVRTTAAARDTVDCAGGVDNDGEGSPPAATARCAEADSGEPSSRTNASTAATPTAFIFWRAGSSRLQYMLSAARRRSSASCEAAPMILGGSSASPSFLSSSLHVYL